MLPYFLPFLAQILLACLCPYIMSVFPWDIAFQIFDSSAGFSKFFLSFSTLYVPLPILANFGGMVTTCGNLFCLTNPSSSITSHFYQGVEDDYQILFVFQGMTFGRSNQSRFFRGLVCYARKCLLLCPTASVILLFISQPACLRLWQLLLQS